jgi:hypothetical protein
MLGGYSLATALSRGRTVPYDLLGLVAGLGVQSPLQIGGSYEPRK